MELIQSGTHLTVVLTGEIDHHTARQAREQIDVTVNKNHIRSLELDFGGVSFMDSSGIGLIMGRYRLMQGVDGKLEVTHASPQIEKLMRLAGLGVLQVIRMEEREDV